MAKVRIRRSTLALLVATAGLMFWLALHDNEVLARGGGRGLSWGYQPPSGNALGNLWRFASPWYALSGGGIIHHSTKAANWNMGSPSSSGGSYGTFSGSHNYSQTNRSVMFPGSSSQPSMSTSMRSGGGGYAPTSYSYSAPTGGPYLSEDRFDPPYYHSYNGYWLHGYWGGGLTGWARWDEELGEWSFPRWGLGPMYYSSGYGQYHNPFLGDDERSKGYASVIELDGRGASGATSDGDDPSAAGAGPTVPQSETEVLKSPQVTAGLKAFDAAREAFRNRDYALALRHSDESLQSLPRDPALHEFRALVLFAQGEFQQSAAVIYAVLAVSPGWDWTTLSSCYVDHDEYTQQLRKLENYRKQNPEIPAAAFLVAYHYAACGHREIAVKHLHNVAKLLADDNLVPHLASLLAATTEPGDTAASPTEGAEPAEPVVPGSADEAPAPLDPLKFAGKWHATRGPDTHFELEFGKGANFTWIVEEGGRSRRFTGSYQFAGDQLLLASKDGLMIGVVTVQSLAGGFNFRMLENAPPAAGLNFDR